MKISKFQKRKNQAGFSLVSAIFIIVILAILGTYMSLMAITQTQSSAMSAQGVRAWYAAVSGIEWVAYQLRPSGGFSSCAGSNTDLDIEGFTVSVTCEDPNLANETESGFEYNVIEISATAKKGSFGQVDHITRSIKAKVRTDKFNY